MTPAELAQYRSQVEAELRAQRRVARPTNPATPVQSPVTPPFHQPAANPRVRPAPVPSQRMLGRQPAAELTEQTRVTALAERRISKGGRVFKLGGVAAAVTLAVLVGTDKLNPEDLKGLVGTNQEPASQDASGDIRHDLVKRSVAVGPEGFNPGNCKQDGAAVATVIINGTMPLKYQLQKVGADGKAETVLPSSYLTKATTASDSKLAPHATSSGYPEMTFNDLPAKVYACAKEGATLTAATDNGLTVNLSELDISIKPVSPDVAIQDQAYMDMSTQPAGVYVTWPEEPYITKNAAVYTDESVDAVYQIHSSEAQLQSTFNVGFKAVVQEASDATPDSTFNRATVFDDGDSKTLYDAIKLGIAERMARDYSLDQIRLNGAIGSIVPQVGSEQPSLLYLGSDKDPASRFILGRTTVMIGDYDSLMDAQASPAASPTETE